MAFLLALALVVSVMSGLGLSVSAEQKSNTPGTEEVQQQDKTEAGAAPSEVKAEEEAAKPEEKPVQEEKADEQKTEAKENADKPAEKQEKATPKAGENVQTATIGTGDKTVTVKTTAAAGVLPEGAKLVVKKLANQDQAYQDAESTLKDSQVTYDDFLALDVGFEVNGKEVEPEAGSVQVQFELGAGLLPETADTSTLAVQHLTDGKAETVTNEVAVTENGMKADFTVNSFSTFTITWWGDDYKKYYEFTAHYIDENGNAINPSASNVELSDNTTINFRNVYGSSINGYDFVGAYYDTYNNANAITTMQATKTTRREGSRFSDWVTRYTVTFKNNSTSVQSFEQEKSNSPTAQKGNIYLVFKKDTTGDTGGTIGDITLPAPGHTKKAVSKGDGTYDLSLDVSGSIGSEAKKVPLDVVMIIDKSNSMNNDNKLTTVKSAAKKLVNTLNGNNGIDVRYNIVEFGGTADPTTNIASSSGWKNSASEAETAISNVRTPKKNKLGGTNYQAGIRVAKQQLNLARTGAQTVVIFFTDGIPTFRLSNPQLEYYKRDGYYDESSYYYYGAGNHDDNGYNIKAAAAEIKGMYTNRFYAVGKYSKDEKTQGANNLQELVKNVNASSKQTYVADNTSQIEGIFNNISSEILELTCTEVSITDTLNENAQIVKTADGKTPLTITVTDKTGKVIRTATGNDEVTLILNETKQNKGEVVDRTLTATYVEDEQNGRQIKLIFPEKYSLEADYTYTVTTPIEPTEKAYEKYQDQKETYLDTPDAGTGTHAKKRENGFYCNNTAQLKYNNTKGDETVDYDKPVIRLTPGKLVIEKTIKGELTDEQVEELKKNLTFKYKLNNGTEQSAKLTKWTKTANGTYTASATVASGLSPDTEYTVTEDADSAKVEGYDVVTTPVSDSGTISKGEIKTASFTNTYTKATQDLTITKAVEGGDSAHALDVSNITYTFEVSAAEGVNANGDYAIANSNGKVTFTNGKASVLIPGTSSITIKGLPVGKYTVTETERSAEPTGYEFDNSTVTKGEAVLTSNKAGQVTITNKYKIKTFNVTVKKEVTGNMGDTNKKFSFTHNGTPFELQDKGTEVFTDVKYGTEFTVSENDYSNDGYTTSYKVNNGDKNNGSACTTTVTAPTTITFVNDKTIQPPNGITTTIAPYAIMVVLAAGAGVYFVYSRRRRNR